MRCVHTCRFKKLKNVVLLQANWLRLSNWQKHVKHFSRVERGIEMREKKKDGERLRDRNGEKEKVRERD